MTSYAPAYRLKVFAPRSVDPTEATVLTGESPDSYNDIEHPDRVAPKGDQITFKNGIANLPPHSLTIIRVPIE